MRRRDTEPTDSRPKQRIKEALLVATGLTPKGDAREHLKAGYVMLSGWQEGIGKGPHDFDVANEDIPIQEQARRIVAVGPRVVEIQQGVVADAHALMNELRERGF